jgi:GNAT superfamily N-acetyltransferase
MLLVEPGARGLGLAASLLAQCRRFAVASGYRQITLWTQSNLIPARALYAKSGFVLDASEPHHSFGHALVAEQWTLTL